MRNRGMKPLLSLLLALALALSVLPLAALGSDPEAFELWIAGVQVTEDNRADVLGDGVFNYNKRTNTLTVDGYCNYPSDYVIKSKIDGLKIESVWDSTLIGDRGCVALLADTILTGDKLTIQNTGKYFTALTVSTKLTILNAELYVDGAGLAMSGNRDNHTQLEIVDSFVSAKTGSTSSQEGAVRNFTGGISLEGCAITEPEDAYIDNGTVTNHGGTPAKQVVIEPLNKRFEVRLGNYLQMGSYSGAPILWRCVSVDENGPLMLADKILCLKAFDAKTSSGGGSHARDPEGDRAQSGSNLWTDSTLRAWLNSGEDAVTWSCGNPPSAAYVGGGMNAYDAEPGFLTSFSELELTAVKTVRQRSAVAELDPYTDGWAPYAPSPSEPSPTGTGSLDGLRGNYDSAYATQSTDRMFLLDPVQLAAVCDNGPELGYYYYIGELSDEAAEYCEYGSEGIYAGSDWQSWLRTPVTDTGASVYAVYPNGMLESEGREGRAFDSEYGVRPAFYLDTDTAVGQGRGTADSPYVVFVEPEAQPTPTPRPTPAPVLTVTASQTELTVRERATLTVSAANIDPSYKLSCRVRQSGTVVKLISSGNKIFVDACAEGTAEITVQASIVGKVVAKEKVTITVRPGQPAPTPTPEPEADFSEISLGNGELYLYKGKDYLQSLSIITDTGDRYFDRGYVDHVYYNSNYPIRVKTYKYSGGGYVESDEIVSAGTAYRVAGYDYVWVQGNAVGRGAVEVTMPNSNGKLCTCRRYVTVTEPGAGVSDFSISIPKDGKYYPNSTAQLSLSVQPAGATYKSLTYTSLDPAVAVVDQNGLITCKGPGQAMIMAEIHNYGANMRYKYAYLVIHVQSALDFSKSYGYTFWNSADSFGYPDGYCFPQSLYEAVGYSRATAYRKSGHAWNGNCVGMSATSQLFYYGLLNSAFYSNREDGKTAYLPHDLEAPNTMEEQDWYLRTLIELFQVSQGKWYDETYLTYASGSERFKPERIRYMAERVKQGDPVVLCMQTSWYYTKGSGHAVLLYDYEWHDNPEYHSFKIYDPSGFVDTLGFYRRDGEWTYEFHYTNHKHAWCPQGYYTTSSIRDGYNYLKNHRDAVSRGARYVGYLLEEEEARDAACVEALTLWLPEGDYRLTAANGDTMSLIGGALSGEIEGVRIQTEVGARSDADPTEGEFTLTLPLGSYTLTGLGESDQTRACSVCDDLGLVELEVPAAATVHFSSELERLGVSNDEAFDYTIRFVAFDSAFDSLELSGTAESRVDAELSGWEAEVVGADTLRAEVTVCGSEVEQRIGHLSGGAVTVRISDELALGLWMDGGLLTEETPLPDRMDAVTPYCDLPSGEYDSPQTARLEAGGDEAVIHYTTDGSAPTEDSPVYVLPVPVNRSMTLRAVACKFGYRDSDELRMDYEFPYAAAPTADVLGGHYVDTQTVRLSGDGTVLYTLDGSDPALYGTEYTQRLVIGGDTVLRAVCVDANGVVSEELWEEYTFTRMYPVDVAALLTDGNGEPTEDFAAAAKITFTLTSYAEIEEADILLACYDGDGKCLGVSTGTADLYYGTASVTLPLQKSGDAAAVKAFFCDGMLAPIAAVYEPMSAEG